MTPRSVSGLSIHVVAGATHALCGCPLHTAGGIVRLAQRGEDDAIDGGFVLADVEAAIGWIATAALPILLSICRVCLANAARLRSTARPALQHELLRPGLASCGTPLPEGSLLTRKTPGVLAVTSCERCRQTASQRARRESRTGRREVRAERRAAMRQMRLQQIAARRVASDRAFAFLDEESEP